MASNTTPSKTDNRFSVSSLLSPPEPRKADSFSNSPMAPTAPGFGQFGSQSTSMFDSSTKHITTVNALGSNIRGKGLPPSPPVSPYDNLHKENTVSSVEDTTRDPPLFPDTASDKDSAVGPLFPGSSANSEHDVAITDHLARSGWKKANVQPTQEEYKLVLECQSIAFRAVVVDKYKQNPKEYMKNERATWELYRPKKNADRTPLRTLAPAPAGVRKQKTVAARSPRAPRVMKRTPKVVALDSFEVKPAAPKAPRVVAPRDDVDFRLLPDYAPPVSTLTEDGRKSLKADWKGQPLDLSADPDRGLLHPSELSVASTLRLTCATYLSNKRRIFAARVKALSRGEDFNKTKAQQACKIDVNKASKLWAAYDRVGWFRPALFEQHIHNFVDID